MRNHPFPACILTCAMAATHTPGSLNARPAHTHREKHIHSYPPPTPTPTPTPTHTHINTHIHFPRLGFRLEGELCNAPSVLLQCGGGGDGDTRLGCVALCRWCGGRGLFHIHRRILCVMCACVGVNVNRFAGRKGREGQYFCPQLWSYARRKRR